MCWCLSIWCQAGETSNPGSPPLAFQTHFPAPSVSGRDGTNSNTSQRQASGHRVTGIPRDPWPCRVSCQSRRALCPCSSICMALWGRLGPCRAQRGMGGSLLMLALMGTRPCPWGPPRRLLPPHPCICPALLPLHLSAVFSVSVGK